MLKRCIYNFPLIMVFILLCFLIFFSNGKPDSQRIWDGFYIVGVPEGSAETISDGSLWPDSEVVSAYNTTFQFNDFGTTENVALSEIHSRFVDGDPRLDPFMTGALDYFSTTDEDGRPIELIYVKSRLSPLNFYFQTRAGAGTAVKSWIFPDFNVIGNLFSVFLFFICIVFGVWLLKGQRIPAAVSSIPWLITIAVNGSSVLPASSAFFIFFILLMREISNDILFYMNHREVRFSRGIFFYLSAFIIAVAIHLYINISSSIAVLPLILSVVSDILCFFIYYSLKNQRVSMQEHSLFFPVGISRKPIGDVVAKNFTETAAALTAVIMIPLFSMFFYQNTAADVPVPQYSETFTSWSWDSLNYINKTYEGLVDASDLVTHHAFQEGFMYSRGWNFPYQGENITTHRYVTENNKILFKEVNIEQFTENWYTSIINPEIKTGLESLLLSQNSPGGVFVKSDITDEVKKINPVKHLIISLLAIMPILGLFISMLSITLRRKGQEA